MRINVSQFHQYNVTDTCAVWNVLSSRVLYLTARSAGCVFCITQFVQYECLHKPRKASTHGPILQRRLQEEQLKGNFQAYTLTVEDLQDISILESRKRLSKGELSSIVFAKKISQAFLTDDQKARKLAEGLLDRSVQTTPHLLGWLFFNGRLTDGDKKTIIDQHVGLAGTLSPHFEAVYCESLRCQLLQRNVAATN
jgi:hypothetical protein